MLRPIPTPRPVFSVPRPATRDPRADRQPSSLAPQGLLLIDNLCRTIWSEIAAGRYADGLSDDGLWQMAWLPARNVFALRYGHQVTPSRPRPRPGETLYRAWSLDELDLLCRLSGLSFQPPAPTATLLIARPE